MKKEAEVLAQFDGRGRIEIVLRGFRVARAGRIQAIAQEMGYALHSREGRSNDVVRLHFIRDDNPLARRRAEETQARIAAGGPCCCRGASARPVRLRPLSRLRRCLRTFARTDSAAGERRSHPYARPSGRRGWLRCERQPGRHAQSCPCSVSMASSVVAAV